MRCREDWGLTYFLLKALGGGEGRWADNRTNPEIPCLCARFRFTCRNVLTRVHWQPHSMDIHHAHSKIESRTATHPSHTAWPVLVRVQTGQSSPTLDHPVCCEF